MMKTLLAILLSSILLSGCAGARKIDIISKPAPTFLQHPPPPRGVTMQPVIWKVLNEEILKALIENGDKVQYVALTANGYNNLSLNMSELIRYMEQQKQIIIYYQNLTKGADIDTPDGKTWKFKDLIPGGDKKEQGSGLPPDVETPPSSNIENQPLEGLNFLSTD